MVITIKNTYIDNFQLSTLGVDPDHTYLFVDVYTPQETITLVFKRVGESDDFVFNGFDVNLSENPYNLNYVVEVMKPKFVEKALNWALDKEKQNEKENSN